MDVIFGEIVCSVSIRMGFRFDVQFCHTLSLCEMLFITYARNLFDKMSHKDLASSTSLFASGNEGRV